MAGQEKALAWLAGRNLQATEEQFYICIKRLLSFEDPADKRRKLIEQTLRQPGLRAFKTAKFEALSPDEKNRLIELTFGRHQGDSRSINGILSIIFALENIRRFRATALAQIEMVDSVQDHWLPHLFAEIALDKWQQNWVCHVLKWAIDWSRLKDPGPWVGDQRCRLLSDWLTWADSARLDLTRDALNKGHAEFRRLMQERRADLPANFFPELIFLVEGPTEALLLPGLAKILESDFDELGVLIVPAGGANQVLRRFFEWKELLNLPIIALLDRDAVEQAELLSESLRPGDYLHVLSQGEIEDVFEEAQFACFVQKHLAKHDVFFEAAGQLKATRRTHGLEKLWREKGLGNFDKIGFAHTIVETIRQPSAIPAELVQIIRLSERLAKGHDHENNQ